MSHEDKEQVTDDEHIEDGDDQEYVEETLIINETASLKQDTEQKDAAADNLNQTAEHFRKAHEGW